MKNYALSLMMLSIFSTMAYAEVWSKFICHQQHSNKSLKFVPEATENEEQQCTFFDGTVAWNARSITEQHNVFTIPVHSGCSHAFMQPDALTSLKFELPADRRIVSYQSGGYYAPIMVTVPFSFTVEITGFSTENKKLFSEVFNCDGVR